MLAITCAAVYVHYLACVMIFIYSTRVKCACLSADGNSSSNVGCKVSKEREGFCSQYLTQNSQGNSNLTVVWAGSRIGYYVDYLSFAVSTVSLLGNYSYLDDSTLELLFGIGIVLCGICFFLWINTSVFSFFFLLGGSYNLDIRHSLEAEMWINSLGGYLKSFNPMPEKLYLKIMNCFELEKDKSIESILKQNLFFDKLPEAYKNSLVSTLLSSITTIFTDLKQELSEDFLSSIILHSHSVT